MSRPSIEEIDEFVRRVRGCRTIRQAYEIAADFALRWDESNAYYYNLRNLTRKFERAAFRDEEGE